MNRDSVEEILVPDYMAEFSCIGAACEDTCCSHWQIPIEQRALDKYNSLADPELTPLFNKHLHILDNPSKSGPKAEILRRKDGTCPFLTQQKLCRIQEKLGAEFLSATCSHFPRIENRVAGKRERFATMSCPEVARLALLRPGGINLRVHTESAHLYPDIPLNMPNPNHPLINNQPAELFFHARKTMISIIQNRMFSVDDRLIILGLLCSRLDTTLKQQPISYIPKLLQDFIVDLQAPDITNSLASIPTNVALQVQLLKELVDARILLGENSERYKACYSEFIAGLQLSATDDNAAIINRYNECYHRFYAPFIAEHSYILENYLVNSIFKNLFPAASPGGMFDEFIKLAMNYALIKLHLVGIGGHHHGLTSDDAVKVIQTFSRSFEHNMLFIQSMLTLLSSKQLNTLPYMAILIRS